MGNRFAVDVLLKSPDPLLCMEGASELVDMYFSLSAAVTGRPSCDDDENSPWAFGAEATLRSLRASSSLFA